MEREADGQVTLRLREELGFQRWEAIQHWLIDGDYLALHCGNYRGGIAEYEKAWHLLSTPWQRQTVGADILKGIAAFALASEDVDLARETLASITPRSAELDDTALGEAIERLTLFASIR